MKSFSEFKNNILISEASREQQFYNRVFDSAKRQGASDIQANTIAAQASIETGYGSSPSGSFNYFGQKAGRGESASNLMTREVINGRNVNMRQPFKNYDSLDASIADRIKKWGYKETGATSVDDALRRLQIPGNQPIPGSREVSHGAYATDPRYVEVVGGVARQYGRSSSPLPSLPKAGQGLLGRIKGMLGLGGGSRAKPSVKGALDTPSQTRVLAKLKGKTGELDKSSTKFTKRGWSSTEGSRYKKFGGK